MRIACLHTADSNIVHFETAAAALGVGAGRLRHSVRTDLLADAEAVGGLTPGIAERTRAALAALAHDNDIVILNCSTLGPAIEGIGRIGASAVFRADAALAAAAVAGGGKLVVLCTVQTTVAPTSALFCAAGARHGTAVEVRLVPDAWALFRAARLDDYLQRIAAEADNAYRRGATTVVFAQSSMTDAAARVTMGPPPMSPPVAALASALAMPPRTAPSD